MPADSEGRTPRTAAPQLPHTWRPFGVRVAVWIFGAMLLAVIVAVWFALGADVRSQFTLFQRSTLVVLGIMLAVTYNSLVRSRVTAADSGLTVVNGYRKRVYEWSQVIGVSLRRGAPWATLDLSDGTTISLIAVQGSDGQRARRSVREIRATIAAHTPGAGA